MSKVSWESILWFTLGALCLYGPIGLQGIIGVGFLGMAWRTSHEHFKHTQEAEDE
jgi:hypothetical protein